MKRASLFGFLVLLGLARAQAQASPVVEVRGCEEAVSEAELARLLALELAELPDRGHNAQIAVFCVENRVEIRAASTPSAAPHTLTLEVGAEERDALTRLLSLRIAELFETVETMAEAPPAPTPPPPPAKGPPSTQRHGVSAALALRRMSSEGLWSFGARLGYDLALGPLVIAPDLTIAFGRHDASPSQVNARDISLGLGLAYRIELPWLIGTIGQGLRTGHVSLSANEVTGYRSRRYGAAWFGPFAALSLALHGRAKIQGLCGAELGYVIAPVRGETDDGTPLIAFDGVWFTLKLGVRYAF